MFDTLDCDIGGQTAVNDQSQGDGGITQGFGELGQKIPSLLFRGGLPLQEKLVPLEITTNNHSDKVSKFHHLERL